MPLPKMTDEQRADALKKAAETRKARSEFRAKIKAGKVTAKKALGVAIGCCGAVTLILSSASAANDRVGNLGGDLLCIGAQFSFALYLSTCYKLIRRYSVFTINRWMFLWATIMILPFSLRHVAAIDFATVPSSTWWETAYVVLFGTYIGYILTMIGQKTLRPTVVSIYNYVQPLVSVIVSVATGIALLRWTQGLAVVLVFSGVMLVTKSKSRRDMEAEARAARQPKDNLPES